MIQSGLTDAACPRFYQVKTPTLALEDFGIKTDDYFNIDMSHIPNYRQKRTNVTNRSSTLPQDQRAKTTEGGEIKLENKRYSQSERLSRSVSHDSGVKSIHNHSSSSVHSGKMKKGTSLTESMDEEDELLNMIDEELFGTYFEKKRKDNKERSLSDSHARRSEIEKEDVIDTEGEDTSESANEMSSLLSHDQLSTDDDDKKDGNMKLRESYLSDDARRGTDHHFDSIKDMKSDEVKVEEKQEAEQPVGEVKSYGDEIIRDTDVNLPESRLLLEDDTNSRATSESGISLMGGQRWDDTSEQSPQNTERPSDGILRLSSSTDYVVLPDLPLTPNIVVDDFGFPLSLFGKVNILILKWSLTKDYLYIYQTLNRSVGICKCCS